MEGGKTFLSEPVSARARAAEQDQAYLLPFPWRGLPACPAQGVGQPEHE